MQTEQVKILELDWMERLSDGSVWLSEWIMEMILKCRQEGRAVAFWWGISFIKWFWLSWIAFSCPLRFSIFSFFLPTPTPSHKLNYIGASHPILSLHIRSSQITKKSTISILLILPKERILGMVDLLARAASKLPLSGSRVDDSRQSCHAIWYGYHRAGYQVQVKS